MFYLKKSNLKVNKLFKPGEIVDLKLGTWNLEPSVAGNLKPGIPP